MKYRNLLVVLLVGIFMVSGTSYALNTDTTKKTSADEVNKTFPGEDDGGSTGGATSGNVNRSPDAFMGNRGGQLQVADLITVQKALDAGNLSEVAEKVISDTDLEFKAAAGDSPMVTLEQHIATMRNFSGGTNIEGAIEMFVRRAVNIVAFDGEAVLENVDTFEQNAKVAQKAGKQVVIVATNDGLAERLNNSEDLKQVKGLDTVYISVLSGSAAAQWSSLLAGNVFLDLTQVSVNNIVASDELIRGLITAN